MPTNDEKSSPKLGSFTLGIIPWVAVAELEPDRLSAEQDRDRQTIAEPNQTAHQRAIARMT